MVKLFISFIVLLFLFEFSVSGTINGVVNRKSGSVNTPIINRYSLRNSPAKDKTSPSYNPDLAIIYLTGEDLNKKKVKSNPEIVQKNLSFDPWLLPVQVGTKVNFPNMDLVFHNVFSYSKTKKFDLGRYGYGQSKPVLFDKPGLVHVFCEIHRTMRAYVLVLETGYFTTSDDKGKFTIKDIPEGTYTLHVWQENIKEYTEKVHIKKDQTINIEIN